MSQTCPKIFLSIFSSVNRSKSISSFLGNFLWEKTTLVIKRYIYGSVFAYLFYDRPVTNFTPFPSYDKLRSYCWLLLKQIWICYYCSMLNHVLMSHFGALVLEMLYVTFVLSMLNASGSRYIMICFLSLVK